MVYGYDHPDHREQNRYILHFAASRCSWPKPLSLSLIHISALGIPLYVAKDYARFETNVIRPFADAYRAGKTPNPCVICNPTTKFALLLEKADELGIELVATGHYASVEERNGQMCIRDRRNTFPWRLAT